MQQFCGIIAVVLQWFCNGIFFAKNHTYLFDYQINIYYICGKFNYFYIFGSAMVLQYKFSIMKVITIKKVRELFNWEISDSTASRKINLLRDALDKPKPKVITEKEFREYYGMDIADKK